jgi:hypothetical protein
MKMKALVESKWPRSGIGKQWPAIRRMRFLRKNREYQRNYRAKLSVAAKSKKFASTLNMSGMVVTNMLGMVVMFPA